MDTLCDFGQPDICDYTVNCTGCKEASPSFKWRRISGGTTSVNTGPNSDSPRKTDPGGKEKYSFCDFLYYTTFFQLIIECWLY